MALTTAQLLDAIDTAIQALTADATAEYQIGNRRWRSHDLAALLREREIVARRLAGETGTKFFLAEPIDQ